jgi:RPA family protein
MQEDKQRTGAFKRSSVTKMLIAELNRTTHALPKPEGQYEAQTYLSPAGRVMAKVMICGTALEKEDVGKEQPLWRMRITDPSGTTQVYAGGMYQPEAAQAIAQIEIPAFVAVVGKLHLYEPEGAGGNVIVSLRPDSISIIDGKGRDDFLLDAALSTLRSVKATSEEKMKEVAAVYGDKDGKDAYVFVAKQALNNLLESFSDGAPAQHYDDKAGEEKSVGKSDADTSKKQDKQESKQSPTTSVPPKLDEKPKPAASSPPSNQKREAAAYPKKEKKEQAKEPAPTPAPVKGKVDKEIDDSIKTVQEVVMQILQEEVQFKYEDLPELLKKKGVNPLMQDWESAVKRLMKEGYCCEPRFGVIRVV